MDSNRTPPVEWEESIFLLPEGPSSSVMACACRPRQKGRLIGGETKERRDDYNGECTLYFRRIEFGWKGATQPLRFKNTYPQYCFVGLSNQLPTTQTREATVVISRERAELNIYTCQLLPGCYSTTNPQTASNCAFVKSFSGSHSLPLICTSLWTALILLCFHITNAFPMSSTAATHPM